MSHQLILGSGLKSGLCQPTLVVGSNGDANIAQKWGELDPLDGFYTWTARQMIDHFGFIEANHLAKTLWQTQIGTTTYFHVSLNQIMQQSAKEKEEEKEKEKDAQIQE